MANGPTPENEILAIGREILSVAGSSSPSIFKRDYWNGQIMEWSMKMPDFKVEMFRFVDVLPVLNDSTEVAKHIQEYFCRDDQDFPAALQWGLKSLAPGSRLARIAASQIEKNVVGMAKTFIAGANAKDAVPTLKKMWKKDMAFTLDLLGEKTVSEDECDEYESRYIDLIENLAEAAAKWKAKPHLETDAFGPIPRVNISIKPSSLYSQIDPAAADTSVGALKNRLRRLFRKANERGVFLNLDTESYQVKDLTFRAFRELLAEPEFVSTNAGCVIQAYLRDSSDDLAKLIAWAKAHDKVFTVRLVKGAYWDSETLLAELHGWTVPVYTDKGATDANYERCARMMLENTDVVRPAFASHNARSLAYAIATARHLGLPDDALEIQMLYGMAEPLKAAMRKQGFRLREYVPVGELIPGMAYLVRRLLENTSNESWLRAKFADDADLDRLLARPVSGGREATDSGYPSAGVAACAEGGEGPFVNEALIDYSVAGEDRKLREALAKVRETFGAHAPLIINGERRRTERTLASTNPADPSVVVGTSSMASTEDVDEALDIAVAAFPAWRDAGAETRAGVLFRAAALMRERRYELAALMVYEGGKQWHEADGDVCEAIDFMEYYGREALRLSGHRRLGKEPGELNHLSYEAIGVTAVIAPWNFPLAILTGMTSAALVAGNAVMIKPASVTPMIALRFAEILLEAGAPPGVCHFLPGRGSEVGTHLVDSPKVDIIVFTGSLEVGLDIAQKAAQVHPGQRYIKRAITELGGKNAIIVDADADLDMAVAGVVKSAFGYNGQKCSACSRVVVLEHNYDAFVERLVAATESINIGPAEDPQSMVGPVISDKAQRDINSLIDAAGKEASIAVRREVPEVGHYVGPTVLTGVTPDQMIAQTEVFGPVLAVMKVADMDEAIDVALSTRYALTGGLYSRSPLNIARARREFRVGNLYINRPITGALVSRQPFGGAMMSGVGSKAGGPDYLQQFMQPRTVTENTIRRGFAPEEPASGHDQP